VVDKKADNNVYEAFIPLIVRQAIDECLCEKKVVNWALRSIRKRNPDLNKVAVAKTIQILAENLTSKTAQWIAKDAIRELTAEKSKYS
jgi:3-methyladenine DNA glycosylase AlkD